MHRGCFVSTPTPPGFRSEDATPGSCACLRVCAPLGQVGQAGLPGAFWCASPSPVAGLDALFVCSAPSGLGLPCLWLLLGVSVLFFLVSPPFSPAFFVFRTGVPWALASCGLPACPPLVCLFLFFCRPLVSGVPWFPARGALGLGALWSPSWLPSSFFFPFFSACLPPPPFFLFIFAVLLFFLGFLFSGFLFRFCVFFVFCLGVPVLRCLGRFVCSALWGVLVCVAVRVVPPWGPVCACVVSLGAPWLCPFCVCYCLSCCGVVVCFVFCLVVRGVRVLGLVLAPCCWPLLPLPGPLLWPVVVFSPAVRCRVALVCRLSCGVLLSALYLGGGAVLFRSRWLVLRVAACGFRLFVGRSGRSPLFFAGVCCRGCSCLAAWLAALLCAVVCCCAPLPCAASCVLWSCVAVWCHAVAPCCPFSFAGGVVSFPCVCGAVLRCASCCLVPVWSAPLVVPRAVVCRCVLWCLSWRSVVWWCCSGVSWCLAVPCCVLWCCIAVWCRGAGLCCVFSFAAGVPFFFKSYFSVFENKKKIKKVSHSSPSGGRHVGEGPIAHCHQPPDSGA